ALTFSTLSMTQAGAMFDVDTLDKYNGPAYRRTEDVAPLDEAAATEAPVVTDAPVVTTAAPVVTTAAPAQAEPTPSTGDASVMVVFAAAAALCIAAVIVIKKREN
ncbi:MAG: LPXTG cell wall anchor domain-containing protein, partial [Clostridia bacterium]|nr:LPXTG cell wall anchor domain-containing protein [Clostridia bacterium]